MYGCDPVHNARLACEKNHQKNHGVAAAVGKLIEVVQLDHWGVNHGASLDAGYERWIFSYCQLPAVSNYLRYRSVGHAHAPATLVRARDQAVRLIITRAGESPGV